MATKHRQKKRLQWRKFGPPILLISPSVILIGIFVYGLIGANTITSMRDAHTVAQYNGVRETKFVWFENYAFLFGDAGFQHSLMNLLLFTVAFLVGTLVLGFLWAWILEQPIKGEGFFRAIFLFPMAVSFIASGVVWRWLLNPGYRRQREGAEQTIPNDGFGFRAKLMDSQHYVRGDRGGLACNLAVGRICYGTVPGRVPQCPG